MPDFHFDITPHIVKQLGEQLVSDEITALLELIKNSYDADASYVSIEINTSGRYQKNELFFPSHKGYIVVEDDGFGMSEETILKSWLIISYSQKREFKAAKRKTPKGRTPLGDKGLGRLSTQRLADICEIFTNEKDNEGTHVAFNWKDFESEETLSNVKIQTKKYKPKKNSGTTLVLANLNHSEVWEGKNLDRFKGQVSQIISPYKENRPFEVYIKINETTFDLDKSNELLGDLAVSRFEFNFDENELKLIGKTKLSKFIGNNSEAFQNYLLKDQGKKFFEFLKNKHPELIKSDDEYFVKFEKIYHPYRDIGGLEVFNGERANPGAFSGKIDEFSYDNSLSGDDRINEVFGKFSNYRDFAQSQVGIKLFRNGFAVKPFGIDGDDWLKLRDSQTSGSSYYTLRPANVIGYVAIDEDINHKLEDKTDREGLVSNPFSRNFYALSFFIRDEINRYQESIRRSFNDFIKLYKNENSGIKTVKQAFKQLEETKSKTEEVKKDLETAQASVTNASHGFRKMVTEVKGNPLFSTDLEKQTANQVDHFLTELKNIENTLSKLNEVISRAEKLNEVIDILEPKIEILEEQLDNFSELAGLGLTAESVTHELASISDRLAERAAFYSIKLQKDNLTESDIYILIEYINTTVSGLKIQLKHLDPALKYSREKKSIISLHTFFKNEKNYYDNKFEKQNIKLNISLVNDFSIEMNQGKLTQVIDNLLNNSEYWLKQRKETETSFEPEITVVIDTPWIYLSDNGFGIAPAVENQIFEPFVTTKPKGEGRGLGLFIIQQLLDASGCSILLEPSKNEHERKYIFAINFSNVIQ